MQPTVSAGPQALKVGLAWLVVAVPLVWGVINTLAKAAALFH